MLETAGFKESDIPKQWKPFWDFWGEVQKRLRAKGERVYGLGITYSTEATDTWQEFDHFLEAYKVRVMDNDGKLLVNDPKVRQGLITVLEDFTRHYKAKNVPPGAISWKDIDNNLNFNNRQVVMVINPTLTIPGSFFGKNDDYYYNKIKTLRWPAAPDGGLFTLRVSVHAGFIPKDSKNKELAKDFVRFLLEPENLDHFVKASHGAFFPALKNLYITCTLLSTIWSIGDFNSVYLLTGGGPTDSTHVFATLGIRYAFNIGDIRTGVATVITALPLVIPIVFVLVRRLGRGEQT